jgi:hypothetical protein
MRLNRAIVAILAGISILLISLIAWVGFNQAQASDTIPNAVYACLPPQTQTTKLWGMTETNDGSYYLIGAAWQNHEATYQEVLIYLNSQDTCRSLLPEDDPVLSHQIPLNLARELALQRYTRVLREQGGRDAYQQQLTDYLTATPEGTRSEFPQEYIWALQQLGITLPPDHYEVLR